MRPRTRRCRSIPCRRSRRCPISASPGPILPPPPMIRSPSRPTPMRRPRRAIRGGWKGSTRSRTRC
ncbi:MAG: hypothetical protein EOP68_23020 [Sphingomonas sp.]|nr:MAG: hypothetical protein EOP68_23020 [Sphingomonas sp.]